ncbi:MAG: hypothetical protein C0404_01690 [Verrucomicrobia bacterium]|nr:hypothetical protein [Verrucomicrobiota bacterium]
MRTRSYMVVLLVQCLLIGQGSGLAVDYVWKTNAGTTAWATGANWVGEAAPPNDGTSDATAVFRGLSISQPDLSANRSVTGVWLMNSGWTLGSTPAAYTLTLGQRGLRMTGGGTNVVNFTLSSSANPPGAFLTVAGGSFLEYKGSEPNGSDRLYGGAGTIRLSGSTAANGYGMTFRGRLTELNLSGTSENAGYTLGDGAGAAGTEVVRVISAGGNQLANTRQTTVNSSTRLDLNGQNEVMGNLKCYGGQIVSGGGSLTVNAGSGAGNTEIRAGSVIDLGAGVFYHASGDIAATAPVTFKAGALDFNGTSGRNLSTAGGEVVLDAALQNGTVTLSSAGYTAVVLNKTAGSGLNATLSASDNFPAYRAGANNAFGTGILRMNTGWTGRGITVTAGSSNTVTLGNSSFSVDGYMQFGASSTYSGGMKLTGTGTIYPETNTLMKTWFVMVNNPSTSSNNWVEFSGNIGEDATASPAALSKTVWSASPANDGTLVLSGQNTFSGTVTLGSGVLRIGSDSGASSGPLGFGLFDFKPYDWGKATVFATKDATARTITNAFQFNGNSSYAGIDAPVVFGDGGWWSTVGNGDLTLTGTGTIKTASTIVHAFNTTTLQGDIAQSGGTYGLTKQGSGTLVLAGSNSFSGGLTISTGTLKAMGRTPGTGEPIGSGNAVTMNRAGGLWIKGISGQTTTNNTGAFTFSGANRVMVENVDAGQTTTLRTASFTRTAPGVIEMTASNLGTKEIFKTSGAAPGVSDGMTYPYYIKSGGDFLTYDSGGGTGFNVVSYTANKLDSGANTDIVTLSAGDTAGQRTVTGTVTRKAVKTSADILGASTPVLSLTGGSTTGNGLSFAGTASVAPKVTFGVGSSEAFIYVASGQTATLNGGIESGSGAITKSGSGALELGGTAYNTGNLNILGGKVKWLINSPLSSTRTVTMFNGAELNLNGFNQTLAGVTMYGSKLDTGAGTLTLGGDVTVGRSGDVSTNIITGNINLGGAKRTFSVSEPNLVWLPVTNLILRAVFSNGNIALNGAYARCTSVIMDGANSGWSGSIDVGGGSESPTIYINRADATGSGQFVIANRCQVRNGTNTDLILANGWDINNATDNGNIGASTDNWLTFTGPINVNANPSAFNVYNTTFAGNMSGTSARAIAKKGGVLVLSGNNSGYAGNITVADNTMADTIRVGSDTALSIGGTLSLGRSTLASADGSARIVAPAALTIVDFFQLGDSVGTGRLTITTSPTLTVNPTIYVADGASAEFTGNISSNGANRTMTKASGGLLILSGANEFGAGLCRLVVSGGSLREASQYALGGANGSWVPGLEINGSILELGYGDFTRGLGNVDTTSGTVYLGRYGTTAGFSGYAASNPETTVRGINFHGDKRKLNWGNTSYFTGDGQPLILSSSNANCAVDFQNDLDLYGDETKTREVRVHDNAAAPYDKAIISGNITNSIPGGNYRSGARLAKTGGGTLDLRGYNGYAGNTEVMAGTLLINGTNGMGVVDVWPGATLGGTGVVSGAVAIGDGGTLAPGNGGVGTLTVGYLSLAAGSTNRFDLGATNASDRVVVNGNLCVGGTLVVTATSGFKSSTYELITCTGTIATNSMPTAVVPESYKARMTIDDVNGKILLRIWKSEGTIYMFR